MNDEIDERCREFNEKRREEGLAPLSRRQFLATMTSGLTALSVPMASCGSSENGNRTANPLNGGADAPSSTEDGSPDTDSADGRSKVYVVKTGNRHDGYAELMSMVDLGFANAKDVVLKPNFNSAQPFPASTHDDTIRSVTSSLHGAGCGTISLAESSGPTGTAKVMSSLGTARLCDELGIDLVNLDELGASEWEAFGFDGMNWGGSLEIPRMLRADKAIVLLPCLKTHFIARFTLSLKLAVGITKRNRRYSGPGTLHRNEGSIGRWIADINAGFTPDLVVVDGTRCFVDGGPDRGTVKDAGILLASTDRVAIDAVGIAALIAAGSPAFGSTGIFEQEQLTRAGELGLGATSPDEIDIFGNDAAIVSELRTILDGG